MDGEHKPVREEMRLMCAPVAHLRPVLKCEERSLLSVCSLPSSGPGASFCSEIGFFISGEANRSYYIGTSLGYLMVAPW